MDEVSDPRVGFLRSDVERFCQQLDGLAPALRMRLLGELRSALVGALDEARVEAMAAAADEGWGLRRIGTFCGVSHEQVRRLLAERQAGGGRPVS
ncbi:hypothetical protein [Streptomyces sp. HC307]|uniref:hypothetical protein n=1 Tax=Streptomyces flavusporus TaxID=3385496 RepID=UPI0039174DD5